MVEHQTIYCSHWPSQSTVTVDQALSVWHLIIYTICSASYDHVLMGGHCSYPHFIDKETKYRTKVTPSRPSSKDVTELDFEPIVLKMLSKLEMV